MGPISVEVQVDAPRERIFAFLSDLSLRPGWLGRLGRDFRLERVDPVGVGAGARTRPGGPGVNYMGSSIVEAIDPERLEERGWGGPLNRVEVRTVWELIEEPGGVTKVRLTFWTAPVTLLDKLRQAGRSRWWERRWRSALREMRDAVESGQAVERTATVAGGQRVPGAA